MAECALGRQISSCEVTLFTKLRLLQDSLDMQARNDQNKILKHAK